MLQRRRLSSQTATVLRLFLQEPDKFRFGLEIVREAGLKSGLLYPILHRLEDRGLLTSVWEEMDIAVAEHRRPRRLYRLKKSRLSEAERLVDESDEAIARRSTPKSRTRPVT